MKNSLSVTPYIVVVPDSIQAVYYSSTSTITRQVAGIQWSGVQ